MIMENEELSFRATKDVDIVLIVESITAEFGRQFWEYVKEAGYEHLNKSTGNAQFYRFTSPKSKEYPFKAKAWLDLKERKLNGEQVDSKNIKKHKNDVFRLAQLITANTRQVLSLEIAEDMKKFLSEIADETVNLKSLGIRGTDKKRMTDMLYQCGNNLIVQTVCINCRIKIHLIHDLKWIPSAIFLD